MRIEFRQTKSRVFLLMVFFSLLGTGSLLRATTVEVENEDDDISAAPTPVQNKVIPQAVPQKDEALDPNLEMEGEAKDVLSSSSPVPKNSPTPEKKKLPLETPTPTAVSVVDQPKMAVSEKPVEASRPRVRISDKVGFYYFVSAGFLASDPSQIPSIGTVVESPGGDQNFTVPKRTYVELASNRNKIKPDDLLVVFRAVTPIHESHTGDAGYQVENLAIVKVIEVQKRRIFVETKESFRPFLQGDRVELYDNEVKRWKQAQVKKTLPAHPVKCFVVGGEVNHQNYEQADFIYLSAGTKMGVVEGQSFDLREITETGAMEESLHTLRGVAQVIFANPNSSTAEILNNHEPIQKSFEAVYQP
jgi:hypothetical protein